MMNEKLIREVMENYPEYSFCMQCLSYRYKECRFEFGDPETDKTYVVDLPMLKTGLKAFRQEIANRHFAATLFGGAMEDPANWDSICTDGLVQCAIFGKVIYG